MFDDWEFDMGAGQIRKRGAERMPKELVFRM